jgi:hypothetical protein
VITPYSKLGTIIGNLYHTTFWKSVKDVHPVPLPVHFDKLKLRSDEPLSGNEIIVLNVNILL